MKTYFTWADLDDDIHAYLGAQRAIDVRMEMVKEAEFIINVNLKRRTEKAYTDANVTAQDNFVGLVNAWLAEDTRPLKPSDIYALRRPAMLAWAIAKDLKETK